MSDAEIPNAYRVTLDLACEWCEAPMGIVMIEPGMDTPTMMCAPCLRAKKQAVLTADLIADALDGWRKL